MFSSLVFVFGLTIGSFLNVLICRLPRGESILGHSKCPKCQKRISWRENIPFLSFVFLKGRCRNCRLPISLEYPIVELLTGFLFLWLFFIYGRQSMFLIYGFFLISLFLVIAFIDLRHFVILDSLISAGFIIASLYLILNALYFILPCNFFSCSVSDSLFGALFFAGILFSIFLLTKGKGMGLGDVKLAALLGFIFGFKNSISVFYLTFMIGAITAIILLSFKKANLKTQFPLGSVMSAAGIIFLFSDFNLLELINAELIFRI